MKFSEQIDNARYRITGYGQGWVRVNENRIEQSFIMAPQTLILNWPVLSLKDLQPDCLEQVLAIPAEVIIIGSGQRQQLPSPAIWKKLVQHGVGFEIMTTDAACRTYNVLLSEARPVVGAFFL